VKIFYLSYSTIPSRYANSMHVMKMCQAYAQEGHEPVLYAVRGPDATDDPEAIWHHYGIQTRFPIRYVSGKPPYREFFRAALQAAAQMRLGRPVAVHARLVNAALWFAALGVPTVCELHGSESLNIWRVPFVFQGQGFRKLLVITRPLIDMYQQRFADMLSRDDFLVAPDGVDIERFEQAPDQQAARQRLGIAGDAFVAGYTGHLYPGRGMELILPLAARLPDVRFVIVGGRDEDIAHWKGQAHAQAISNVQFVGFVPNADLPPYQAACDVLLMPHQRVVTVEGNADIASFTSPLKMFEYMASRRLIIASNLPVLREVLNDTNAVLCDPEDIEAWAHALVRARADAAWREQISSQAWRDVQQYSWRRRVQRIVAAL